ncbi:DNA helicase II [Colwellia sp. M166]|uniref:DNA helicase II n=1 Tax=Colwellia sp. M166 TaxID=2583805 RepID=UPI00211EF91A|nr:DNA helicase II [Colwellia sp. M166]UUO23660.1 DNA helicase II [Colwellia sp. M166]|tara:strand:- start:71142 stop:73316 length:2175 start_codon:yes stop_codon:yes gene_type:complete
MDVSELLDSLNDKQRDVVAAPLQNMLVLAGAGSGKTRVLVQRIAWLMKVEHASPHSILAVTFTNKAAAEMRARVEQTVDGNVHGMWVGTFHGLAHRLLRMHFQEAKLPQSFQVLDSDDQLRMVKRIVRSLELDEKRWPAKQFLWYINGKKDEGLRPQHIDTQFDVTEETFVKVYRVYQDTCDRAGLVDFAELLLRAHELWLNNPELLQHYQQRFAHVLVDEFQDTNAIQYAWLNLLGKKSGNVMIVGDDDQSIYGWRGAKIENIQRFLQDFDGAQTIKLEQNYRSTANILNAANQLIGNNSNRLGKDLWTDGDAGEKISIYTAFNEIDEARFIAGRITEWRKKDGSLDNVAILYRSNAQSRLMEEALIQAKLPYKIYGGLRFFERQEIKDALAYLRLLNNRDDDAAFERVINTPTRGIGNQTLSLVRDAARSLECTLWQACQQMMKNEQLKGRSAKVIQQFINVIDQLEDDSNSLNLDQQANYVIQHSGLKAMYQAEKGERAEARIENLNELVTACQTFEVDPELEEEQSPLTAFLTHAALESGESQADEHESAVQLMTMHSAKGLEFPLVFIAGLEEGMFPSQQSVEDISRLEEERRLCYVGMTRAMQKLYLCHAESRRLYGQEKNHKASRFLRELPEECIEEVRLQSQVSRPKTKGRFSSTITLESFGNSGFKLGQNVRHKKFGDGVVLNYEGSGPQSRIQVNFADVGCKWLVVAYANLETL